jgi:hypothetical protein
MRFKLEDKLLKLANVFGLVDRGAMTLKEAAVVTGYSYWHLTRLYRRYRQHGIKRLFKRHRKCRPAKLTRQHTALLKKYYRDLEQPQLSLLLYFLRLDHPSFPAVSREWTRQTLIRTKVYAPGSRSRKFRKRFEAPAPGILVQGDSTPYRWIPGDDRYYHLIAFIDDCTRVCLAAALAEHDSIPEHFRLLKRIVRRRGRFVALYYDNDEKYRYIRHKRSRHYTYHTDEADLQVVRALSELSIVVINSKPFDPCGKGKIERFLQTCQLQLPVWFRRYRVRTLGEANRVLARYIRYYNKTRVHRELQSTPRQKFDRLGTLSRFRPVDSAAELGRVFSYRYQRVVDRANTIRFSGAEYQLQRNRLGHSYCGKRAELRYLPDKPLRVFIDGRPVRCRKLLTLTRNRTECSETEEHKVAVL